jgi:rhodanese-related sulfurtransferase
MHIGVIGPRELHDLHQGEAQVYLIDVRTPVEFREMHATMARNFPLESLDPDAVMNERSGMANDTIYVICRSGSRGAKACERFNAAGYSNVVNVEGGTEAWDATGLPVVRGKKAISLERQVRIAAGSLVLIGAVLGFIVHPSLIGLSAFVGAGLVFAGVTDTCGMAMVLARLPWNKT